MKALKGSLPAKCAAVILLIVSCIAACLSFAGVFFAWENGIYTSVDNSFYDSGAARSAAFDYGYYDVLDTYAWMSEEDFEFVITHSESDVCNFAFELIWINENEEQAVLASTIKSDQKYASQYVWDHTYSPEEGQAEKGYRVTVAVKDPMPYRYDSLYQSYQLFETVKTLKVVLPVVLLVSIVLCVALFLFLCAAAGHRKGTDQIVLNWLDRIPLDLYAAAVFLGVVFLWIVSLECGFNNIDLFANVLGGLGMLGCVMLALALTLSFAARVKAGRWWRNTIICYVLIWGKRMAVKLFSLCGSAFHALPMIWRTALIIAALLVILFVLAVNCAWGSGFFLLLYAWLSFVILAAAGAAAWQLRKLQKGGEVLASGSFDSKIDTSHMYWDFKRHAEHLNTIGDGMSIAVEQRMKSERLKTELITNVSHDIKTPLTSIINYVDLLQKPHTDEERIAYLEVLQRQSARLKKLTEDLVEASKASTGNIAANLVRTDVTESLNQALGEYGERLADNSLTVVMEYPDTPLEALADGRLLWRVLDNLLNNICKYAMQGTRVYVAARAEGDCAVISLKNISSRQLNISAGELMERFVRGDASRTTEGSGLGLNIARSLMELQKGDLQLTVDGDLFKAEIRLLKYEKRVSG